MVRGPTCPPICAHLVCSIPSFLGIAVVQFFQCMSVLLNRTRRDIKWGLVVHTVSMFLCVTINITGNLYVQSTTYPDPLKFPGIIPIPPAPIEVAANLFHPPYYAMFYLNQWLADSLLVSPVLKSAFQVSNVAAPSVLSFLCYLCHELLVHRLTMPDIPRQCGYVFDLS